MAFVWLGLTRGRRQENSEIAAGMRGTGVHFSVPLLVPVWSLLLYRGSQLLGDGLSQQSQLWAGLLPAARCCYPLCPDPSIWGARAAMLLGLGASPFLNSDTPLTLLTLGNHTKLLCL